MTGTVIFMVVVINKDLDLTIYRLMDADIYNRAETKNILRDYASRMTLTPQDVVKCFLRIYAANVSPAYDCRVNLWDARAGDVVYLNGRFLPLLTAFSVDNRDGRWRCVHTRERESGTRYCDRQCQKWYALYKKEDGRSATCYPDFDGLTTIRKADIAVVLTLLKHPDVSALRQYFALASPSTLRTRRDFIDKLFGNKRKKIRHRLFTDQNPRKRLARKHPIRFHRLPEALLAR